jgi:dihydroxyacetone kinase
MAGIVLVQKIVGALAETGASIDSCESMASFLGTRLATLAASLGHVHVPGTSKVQHSKALDIDEIELGNGIHNEPVIILLPCLDLRILTLKNKNYSLKGYQTVKPIPSAAVLSARMIDVLTDIEDAGRSFVEFRHDGKDEVVLMVNNL